MSVLSTTISCVSECTWHHHTLLVLLLFGNKVVLSCDTVKSARESVRARLYTHKYMHARTACIHARKYTHTHTHTHTHAHTTHTHAHTHAHTHTQTPHAHPLIYTQTLSLNLLTLKYWSKDITWQPQTCAYIHLLMSLGFKMKKKKWTELSSKLCSWTCYAYPRTLWKGLAHSLENNSFLSHLSKDRSDLNTPEVENVRGLIELVS